MFLLYSVKIVDSGAYEHYRIMVLPDQIVYAVRFGRDVRENVLEDHRDHQLSLEYFLRLSNYRHTRSIVHHSVEDNLCENEELDEYRYSIGLLRTLDDYFVQHFIHAV